MIASGTQCIVFIKEMGEKIIGETHISALKTFLHWAL